MELDEDAVSQHSKYGDRRSCFSTLLALLYSPDCPQCGPRRTFLLPSTLARPSTATQKRLGTHSPNHTVKSQEHQKPRTSNLTPLLSMHPTITEVYHVAKGLETAIQHVQCVTTVHPRPPINQEQPQPVSHLPGPVVLLVTGPFSYLQYTVGSSSQHGRQGDQNSSLDIIAVYASSKFFYMLVVLWRGFVPSIQAFSLA